MLGERGCSIDSKRLLGENNVGSPQKSGQNVEQVELEIRDGTLTVGLMFTKHEVV